MNCDHPPAAQVYVPPSGQSMYRYCHRCRRHWTWVDGGWFEDSSSGRDDEASP